MICHHHYHDHVYHSHHSPKHHHIVRLIICFKLRNPLPFCMLLFGWHHQDTSKDHQGNPILFIHRIHRSMCPAFIFPKWDEIGIYIYSIYIHILYIYLCIYMYRSYCVFTIVAPFAWDCPPWGLSTSTHCRDGHPGWMCYISGRACPIFKLILICFDYFDEL